MSEAELIEQTESPATVESMVAQFAACGLAVGQTVVVHSSMSKIGWIAGGALAVIQALQRVLGETGTLMMPTQTTDNTDPAQWVNPPVPESWWQVIRDHMPGYDPVLSPTRQMGTIAELFRTMPGVIRSAHPVGSFAAFGPKAEYLTGAHNLEDEFGATSPIGRLYELDGYVLLLGVKHWNNTSLHLAEYRANYPGKQWFKQGSAMLVNGQRKWVDYKSLDLNGDDFGTIGDAYEADYNIRPGKVGNAEVRFMKQRPVVDYAVQWMERNRN